MRTKALVCAAVLAAGLASSMAQSNVYSLNVVGYYNVTVPPHSLYMIANQLNTTNNMLSSLIPAPSDGSAFYHYNAGWQAAIFDGLGMVWDNDYSLAPGQAGFFKNNDATPQTITFVGEVLQGSLVNTLPVGVLAAKSSMVPQAGTVTGVLGVPAEDGDAIYTWTGGWTANIYDGLGNVWDSADPGGPVIAVGQSFFYKKSPTGTQSSWVRNFTVQ
jgi:hypothetical protein